MYDGACTKVINDIYDEVKFHVRIMEVIRNTFQMWWGYVRDSLLAHFYLSWQWPIDVSH